MRQLEAWLLRVWYEQRPIERTLLLPLTAVFCVVSAVRRLMLKRKQVKHSVPVIVVGNITVGGTGKTPIVIWLVQHLQKLGFKPAVVSRGYGGKDTLSLVTANSDVHECGDEPLLIAQRTEATVVVGRNRNAAITWLLTQQPCDIVVSDDGLQHYQLARDLDIAVVDGQRLFGNGYCLPAGALRERVTRLKQCDYVLINGETVTMRGNTLFNVASNIPCNLENFAGKRVHAVTGIGNPQRFFDTLHAAHIQYIPHVYPDHHAFKQNDLQFAEDLPLLMTEKDAVKCRVFAQSDHWYLPISAEIAPAVAESLLARLQGFKHEQKTS